jgi:hypothetical protein
MLVEILWKAKQYEQAKLRKFGIASDRCPSKGKAVRASQEFHLLGLDNKQPEAL